LTAIIWRRLIQSTRGGYLVGIIAIAWVATAITRWLATAPDLQHDPSLHAFILINVLAGLAAVELSKSFADERETGSELALVAVPLPRADRWVSELLAGLFCAAVIAVVPIGAWVHLGGSAAVLGADPDMLWMSVSGGVLLASLALAISAISPRVAWAFGWSFLATYLCVGLYWGTLYDALPALLLPPGSAHVLRVPAFLHAAVGLAAAAWALYVSLRAYEETPPLEHGDRRRRTLVMGLPGLVVILLGGAAVAFALCRGAAGG